MGERERPGLGQRGRWLLLLMFPAICLLPFLGKGLSIDDGVYWDYADRLTANPTVCRVADATFLGRSLPDLVVFESTHPPLVPYWLKLLRKLFGDSLPKLHAGFSVFLLGAGVSLAWWTRRFTGRSPWLAMTVISGSLMLPCATGFMTDVALFAFWFGAMACWERALDGPRKAGRWHLATVACAVGASFTAYQGLLLIPILGIQGCGRRRWSETGAVAFASVAPLAGWIFLVWRNYGSIPYFVSLQREVSIAQEIHKGLVVSNIVEKSFAITIYIGCGLLVPLLVMAVRPSWRRPAGIALSAGALGALVRLRDLGIVGGVWGWLLLSAGILALVVVAGTAVEVVRGRSADRTTLVALLGCVLTIGSFQAFLAPFAAPRYILVLLGAVYLLVLRQLPAMGLRGLTSMVGVTTGLGLLVAGADLEYAQAQRLDRLELPQETIHFVGEGGAKHTGERAGFVYYLPGSEARVDNLLVPRHTDHVAPPRELLVHAKRVKEIVIPGRIPIRVMNRDVGAGFYIHARGPLPFVPAVDPVERFTLYRMPDEHYRSCVEIWRQAPHRGIAAGEILPATPVAQEFQVESDGLAVLNLFLATNAGRASGILDVSLREVDGSEERLVFRDRVAAGELEDNSWRSISFAPQASQGRIYRLTLSSPDAVAGSAATIWANSNAPGSYRRGGDERAGSLSFDGFCRVDSDRVGGVSNRRGSGER